MKVTVNRIIPFSSVDGPGNRTAVFLQGCNINCKYCHNPETRALCVGCGLCVKNCPAGALGFADEAETDAAGGFAAENAAETDAAGGFAAENAAETRPAGARRRILFDPVKCVQCDTCIHICPHDSSPRTADMTPEEVYAKVRRQIPFIRGITVSGGECMLYPDFLTELFRLAKADGLNTMIDSNGTISFRNQPELLAVTDGVMLDIKAFFTEDHKRVTDHGNETVLDNAVYLSQENKLFEVRAVIAPDLYDAEKSIRAMGDFLKPMYEEHPFRIKVIAYRPMGVRPRYADMTVPDVVFLKKLADILHDKGFSDIIII